MRTILVAIAIRETVLVFGDFRPKALQSLFKASAWMSREFGRQHPLLDRAHLHDLALRLLLSPPASRPGAGPDRAYWGIIPGGKRGGD